MRRVTRQRQLGGRRRYCTGGLKDQRGSLPSFSKAIGLDFIITPSGAGYLIELQHGFGRRGLLALYPLASRAYRQTYWQLRRGLGKSPWISAGIRQICSDKIKTYREFARYQPASLVYQRWSPGVERWLSALPRDQLLVAKPPRGSCGRGIVVLRREQLLRSDTVPLPTPPFLLQEYIASRELADARGEPHVGCIRHIVLMQSDSCRLGFIHLPPYWRVSPVPLASRHQPDPLALTANISRGAYPLEVSAEDTQQVVELAERICTELIQRILELPGPPVRGVTRVIRADEPGGIGPS